MMPSIQTTVGREVAAALVAAEGAAGAAPAKVAAAPVRREPPLAIAARALTSAKKKTSSKNARRPSTGYAPSTKKASSGKSTSASARGALAFLDDPRLSTEEKLFRFMMYVSEKYDRDIEEKMKGAGGGGGSAATQTTTKKSSNPLSKIAGALKAVVPGAGLALETLGNKNLQSLLKTVSGPVLAAGATALGMPALAPLLAKVGPQLAGATIDLAKALDAPGTTVSTTSSGTSGAASTGGEPQLDQRRMMELQYAMDKQKEMFSLVSNILRSMHDMKMVAVQNVRS
jgi:hypothetical protein